MKRRKKGFLIVLVVLLLIGAVGFIVWVGQKSGYRERRNEYRIC